MGGKRWPEGREGGTIGGMDEKTPKRPLWKLHPYSVIVFVLAITALLMLNDDRFHYKGSLNERVYGVGVPFVFQDSYVVNAAGSLEESVTEVDKRALLYDVVIWAMLLFASVAVSEFLIHRREARKP